MTSIRRAYTKPYAPHPVVHHLSVSQTKTFKDCPRWWYFKKILKHSEPQGAAAGAGKITHYDMEEWIKDVSKIPKDPSAKALMGIFPGIHAHKRWVEEAIEFSVDIGGGEMVPFEGYIDLILQRAGYPIEIWDHKTSGSWHAWVLKAEQLSEDVQMAVYAAYVFSKIKGNTILLGQSQVNRKNQTVRSPTAYITRAEVQVVLEEVTEIVRLMVATAKIKDVNDVPKGPPASCQKFGGCPHRFQCDNAHFLKTMEQDMTAVPAGFWDMVGGAATPAPLPSPKTDATLMGPPDPTAVLSPQAQPNQGPIDPMTRPVGWLTSVPNGMVDVCKEIGVITVGDLISRLKDGFKLKTLHGVGDGRITKVNAEIAEKGLMEMETPALTSPQKDNAIAHGACPTCIGVTRVRGLDGNVAACPTCQLTEIVEDIVFKGRVEDPSPQAPDWMTQPVAPQPLTHTAYPSPQIAHIEKDMRTLVKAASATPTPAWVPTEPQVAVAPTEEMTPQGIQQVPGSQAIRIQVTYLGTGDTCHVIVDISQGLRPQVLKSIANAAANIATIVLPKPMAKGQRTYNQWCASTGTTQAAWETLPAFIQTSWAGQEAP